MAYADALPPQRRFGETARPDAWWVQPLAVFLGFSAFIVYSTWAAFHPLYHGNCAYWFSGNGANYLVAVLLAGNFRQLAAAVGSDRSPAGGRRGCCSRRRFLILWAPAGFRFTCYYYRGAYYKAFWADPPDCAVGEPRKAISANAPSRSSCRTSTATSCTSRCCSFSFSRMTPGRRCGSRTRRARNISASASERWCWR